MPRVCAICIMSDYDKSPGAVWCERAQRYLFDTGDGEQWFHTCDYWRGKPNNAVGAD